MNLLIVGGGRAAEIMLDYFQKDKEVNIIGVCDINDMAPGIIKAKMLGIPTFKNMMEMISKPEVQLVVEITGNTKVRDLITKSLRPDQDLMSAGGALLMSRIHEVYHQNTVRIADDLSALTAQMDNAMNIVDKTVVNIKSILIKIQMIAINGNIEACKAGKEGAAFQVVAQHLEELVNEVDKAVGQIVNSSQKGHNVLEAMEKSEERLRQESI